MLRERYPYYLANEAVFANTDLEVTDKYTGQIATRVALADAQAINTGISAAVGAEAPMRRMPAYERRAVIEHCITQFKARFEEFAAALCIEAGKPIKDSRGEVGRLIDTFAIAADESVRVGGEVMNLEIAPRARGYSGMTKRVPIGACSFISPFNFPLNLAAHKIAPALAMGCPFVLKPASRTPIGALMIGEILAQTQLPKGAFSILPAHRDGADLFTTDDRLKLLSFTGSPGVGWELKAKAGRKKVVLELGGNAACVIDSDQAPYLDHVIERLIFGGYYQSGQSCIHVQRIYVHRSLYQVVKTRLVTAISALKLGDPKHEDTFVGPMISEGEAKRLHQWVLEAIDAGGNCLIGAQREGAMLAPTLIENCPHHASLYREEAFGPAVCIEAFDDFETVLSAVNDSKFGLQAGIFTRDLYKAQLAWDELDVGGVIVGDVPSWRVDNMPYGGVKDSGLGREGVKFAMEDMSEIRLMVIKK
jgi:acyl-CoA reductase-like NAD-dependent aldehyde dehydrogenase